MKSAYRRLNARLLCGAGAAAILAMASAAQAEVRQFDIPAQSLGEALAKFGSQSDLTIVSTSALTRSKNSQAVTGAIEPELALAQMLSGTGLTYRREGDTFLIVSATDPQPGSAAGDGADQGTVAALVVTAQKREENIQDVPIAMSAFTQEDLTRSQVAGGPDLMTQVPNFTFTKTNFSSYSIQIRGIGTQAISATVDPAVAVAFNNTPFIRNRFFEQEFFDLQRVEVLRGPQGTLYGRNATAGVVNIISAKPTFHYEARLSADVANYNSTRLEGMLNLPLVEDKVGIRLAGAWTKRDGYATNQLTGHPIDGRDLWSTRLSLRVAPTDWLDTSLIWEHFEENDDRLRSGKQLCEKDIPTEVGGLEIPYAGSFPGINPPTYQQFFSQGCKPASLYSPDSFETPNGMALPYFIPLGALGVPVVTGDFNGFDPYASTTQSHDLRVIESTVDPQYKAETNTVELQFRVDLPGNLSLNSETGYLSDTLFSTQDYNRFNTASGAFKADPVISARAYEIIGEQGVFCDPQIGCADRLVAVDLSTATSHQFSQELRLSSNYGGKLNFSLGGNFLRYDTEDKYYVFINTISMAGAVRGWLGAPPYVPSQTDNHECLRRGYAPPDPNGATSVVGCLYMDPNPIGSLNDLGHNYFLSKNPYKLISYAAFGEAYYKLAPNLTLTAGLRWTVDKKEAPRIPSWILAADATVGYPVAEVVRQEWREPTGRLTIDWKPDLSFSDETLLYASFAHGYKAGGANPPSAGLVMYDPGSKDDFNMAYVENSALRPKRFNPEFVDAVELGAKNTFLGGMLTANAAAFYYDYQGYQVSQLVDRAAVNLNFDAKVWGLEIEADWRPLENLRLGFKGGYESTRLADGSRAVDPIDRTAGHTDWFVSHPFPSLPNNCILPVETVTYTGSLRYVGNAGGGTLNACELAYIMNVDPVTVLAYTPDPTMYGNAGDPGNPEWAMPWDFGSYAGFNPETAPNGGAGFYKDLSGNALPNAPHYTATVTADYTLPLPNEWMLALHTDLYYQSEAWTRVFNTPGYDKLKAYTNVNVAAIFTNEDAGWKVMAYVKNVFDRDSITGAFLNSDDTGLTTNVFLTEPRLYGLRVTKEWSGGPWWTGVNPNHPAGEPYPFTVELSGQVQRQDAPYERITPSFIDAFSQAIRPATAQNRDLDWGDGREARFTYRPDKTKWNVSAGVRYGRTNSHTARVHLEEPAGPVRCAWITTGPWGMFGREACDPDYVLVFYGMVWPDNYKPYNLKTGRNWSDDAAWNREEHTIVDFDVGRDFGLGLRDNSRLRAGLRYAAFESDTSAQIQGAPDTMVPDAWQLYPTSLHVYRAEVASHREFSGMGPTIGWAASMPLLGDANVGRVGIDWSIGSGVLFGKQKTAVRGSEFAAFYSGSYNSFPKPTVGEPVSKLIEIARSKSVSAPFVDLSLGLSYDIQRIKVSTGYRWERYFNVLDGGYQEHKSYDRTIDGPYFKVAVGFDG